MGSNPQIDSLIVVWPGGNRQKFYNIDPNQLIRIVEDESNYDVPGCMDATASNFDPDATYDYGCFVEVIGCTNDESVFYDPLANTSNGDCPDLVTSLPVFQNVELKVYPNPAIHSLNIDFGSNKKGILSLSDLSGREVIKLEVFQVPIHYTPMHFNPGSTYLILILRKAE